MFVVSFKMIFTSARVMCSIDCASARSIHKELRHVNQFLFKLILF
jgi:hypothetical protein